MSAYLTEEEQIEQIKKYWKKYGTHVLTVILIIVLSVTGYRFYQERHDGILTKASQSFNDLMATTAKKDRVEIEAKATYIKTTYPSTIYATSSALLLAKQAVEHKRYDAAISELTWVLKNAPSDSFKQIARLRLSRIYLYQKNYDQALSILTQVDDKLLSSMIHEVKGDIFSAQGKKSDADEQYKLALADLPNPALASKQLQMKISSAEG